MNGAILDSTNVPRGSILSPNKIYIYIMHFNLPGMLNTTLLSTSSDEGQGK